MDKSKKYCSHEKRPWWLVWGGLESRHRCHEGGGGALFLLLPHSQLKDIKNEKAIEKHSLFTNEVMPLGVVMLPLRVIVNPTEAPVPGMGNSSESFTKGAQETLRT